MASSFTVRTLEEARSLAKQLALLCPNPDTAIIGLVELLINAVEHGNLEITYEYKSHLQDTDGWGTEVEKRLSLPENRAKRVTLQMWRSDTEIRFLISDQGKGFDWHPFLDIDTDRLLDTHGRGIAMAKSMSFDRLEYQGNGNRVLAVIYLNNKPTGENSDHDPAKQHNNN